MVNYRFRGNKYIRKRVIHADGSIIHSCSCPSFTYCKTKPPGCKHIMLLDEAKDDDDDDDDDDTVQLEDNVDVHEWSITGSGGNKYMRKRVIHADGSIIHSCSCPSFTYCKTKPPGCKHIKQ